MRKHTPIFSSLLIAALACALPAAAQGADAPAAAAAAEPSAEAAEAKGEATRDAAPSSESSSDDVKVVESAEEDEPFPFSMSGSLSNYVGAGTFVPGYANNSYVATSLGLAPSLSLGDFSFSASQGFDLEWTRSDSTTYNNQILWGDTGLRVGWSGLRLPDYNLGWSFSGGATLPISLASRHVGKITNTSAGARMSWGMPEWGLGTFVGASANYNWVLAITGSRGALDPVQSYADRAGTEIQPSGCLRREATELANQACAYIPAGFGYGLNSGVSWSTLEGQLSFAASVAWMQSFAGNEGKDDEFTPRVENVQTGLQWKMPATSGSLTASYTPVEWFTLSAGTSSFQPLMTSDNKAVRWFPFWSLPNLPDQCIDGQFCNPAANNLSTVFVDTTFTY